MKRVKLMIAIMCVCILISGTFTLSGRTDYKRTGINFTSITIGTENILIPRLTEEEKLKIANIVLAPVFNAKQTKFITSVNDYREDKSYVLICDFISGEVQVLGDLYDGAEAISTNCLLDDGTLFYTLYWDAMQRVETRAVNINTVKTADLPVSFNTLN